MATKFMLMKQIEVRGQKVDVHVGSSGYFFATPEGKTPGDWDARLAEAKTYEEVLEQTKKKLAARRVEVKIEFSQVFDYSIRDGVAKGIHQKDHDTLVRYADGVTGQLRSYTETLRRMTEAEKAPLEALGETIRAKRDELNALIKQYDGLLAPYKPKSEWRLVAGKREHFDGSLQAEVRRAIEAKVAERLAETEVPRVLANGEGVVEEA
jgi:hypothetical protein